MPESPDLGPLPKVHPRSVPLRTAGVALREFTARLVDDYNLTSAEYLYLLSTEVAAFGQRMVDIERRQSSPPPEPPCPTRS